MKLIALDTETTGLDVFDPSVQPVMVSGYSGKKGFYLKAPLTVHELAKLKEICASKEWTKLFFNAKFDIRILAKLGIEVKHPYIDVAVMARLILTDNDKFDLKSLARHYLEDPYTEEIAVKKWMRQNKHKLKDGYGSVPDKILGPYAVKDAIMTYELFMLFRPALKELNLEHILKKETKILRVVMGMEDIGIKVDTNMCKEFIEQVDIQALKIKKELAEIAGIENFNPNAPKQVHDLVYNGNVFPTRFSNKTGMASTDKVALLEIGTHESKLIIEYRQLTKAKTTYLRKFAASSGVIHPSFNTVGAVTGRFSSSNPNLQNIPRPKESFLGRVRSCFKPREGTVFLFSDYDQIEIRLGAHFSGDEELCEAIRRKEDIHSRTAKRVFEISEESEDWDLKRYIAKTLNFAMRYGAGPQTFMNTLLRESGIKISIVEAVEYVERYKSENPAMLELFRKVDDEVYEKEGITNPYGRFVKVPRSQSYIGVNYLIQSTAADVLKDAMLRIDKLLKGSRTNLILTIHDELVFELDKKDKWLIPEIKKTMEVLNEFSVPLTCSLSVGRDWGHKIKITGL